MSRGRAFTTPQRGRATGIITGTRDAPMRPEVLPPEPAGKPEVPADNPRTVATTPALPTDALHQPEADADAPSAQPQEAPQVLQKWLRAHAPSHATVSRRIAQSRQGGATAGAGASAIAALSAVKAQKVTLSTCSTASTEEDYPDPRGVAGALAPHGGGPQDGGGVRLAAVGVAAAMEGAGWPKAGESHEASGGGDRRALEEDDVASLLLELSSDDED